MTTTDEKVHKQKFYKRINHIQRQLEEFLIFFRSQILQGNVNKNPNKSSKKINEEDYQKLHLVLLFFMAIKRERPKKKGIWKSNLQKSEATESRQKIPYKKLQKYFFENVVVQSDEESTSSATFQEKDSVQSTPKEQEFVFDFNKVVQSAYFKQNDSSKLRSNRQILQQNKYDVAKELSKSAAEIKQGIHKESQKQNQLLRTWTKKLLRQTRSDSKECRLKKKLKLQKNLQFMKDRQELKILESSWKTHSRYQKTCGSYNLAEIMRVTEAKSKKSYQGEFILKAMNIFIMVFVFFFIFVSLSTIYLIKINQF